MVGRRVVQCEVDDAYAYSFSDDPAIGTLTPTLCSHRPSVVVTLRSRRSNVPGAPTATRDFRVCATHRAIVAAFDRTIQADGGQPRLVAVRLFVEPQ